MPIQIKAKYYPLVLFAVFGVFFGQYLQMGMGVGVGYLYIYGYLKFMDLSVAKVKRIESKKGIKKLQDQSCNLFIFNF